MMSDSAEPLSGTVYEVLRAIAHKHMGGERKGHTLSATALVHEAWLKLPQRPDNPAAFYRAAGDAMRRILIDHARSKSYIKRGGGWHKAIESVETLAAEASESQVRALDDAFARLEAEDERAATVVRLRFYAGLTIDQTAQALGMSPRGVNRDWDFARAFLLNVLERDQSQATK